MAFALRQARDVRGRGRADDSSASVAPPPGQRRGSTSRAAGDDPAAELRRRRERAASTRRPCAGKVVVVGATARAPRRTSHATPTSDAACRGRRSRPRRSPPRSPASRCTRRRGGWTRCWRSSCSAVIAPARRPGGSGTSSALVAALVAVVASSWSSRSSRSTPARSSPVVPPLGGRARRWVRRAGRRRTRPRSPARRAAGPPHPRRRGNQRTRRLRALAAARCRVRRRRRRARAAGDARAPRGSSCSTVDTRFESPRRAAAARRRRAGRDRRQDVHASRPSRRGRSTASDHAQVIRNLAEAGAKVIAYDVQFTRGRARDPKADERADRGGRRGAGNVVLATTEVDDQRPRREISRRFGEGARRTAAAYPAISSYLERRRRQGSAAWSFDSTELERVRDRGGASSQRAARSSAPAGDDAWIDFAGPARHGQVRSASSTSSDGKFDPAGRARQGRRGRRDRARRCRTSTRHLDDARRPDARARRSRRRDRAPRSTGFPLQTRPTGSNALLVIVLGAARAVRRRCGCGCCPRSPIGAAGDRASSSSARSSLFKHAARSSRSSIRSSPASPAMLATGGDPRPDGRVRARAGARRVRALRAGGRRRPGAGRRRRRAPRRRARRGHGHVQRPARVHVVLRDARAGARDRVAQPLPDRDERGDPRPRRHARRLHGRRHHGRVRRAAQAGRPRRPRARGRARDARPDGGLQRLAARAGAARRLQDGHRAQQRRR